MSMLQVDLRVMPLHATKTIVLRELCLIMTQLCLFPCSDVYCFLITTSGHLFLVIFSFLFNLCKPRTGPS